MSGLNERFAKPSNPKGSAGSNPASSAIPNIGDIWEYCGNNTYVVIGKDLETVDLFDLENLQYHYFYSTRDFAKKFYNGGEMWKRLYQYKPD